MAATIDQPISVGNLAAALSGVGIPSVTLLHKDDAATQASPLTVTLPQDASDFDMLLVIVKWSGQYQMRVMLFPGEVDSASWANGEYGGGVYLQGANTVKSGNGGIQRIYGIRSGGGRLLADALLAAMGGER